MIDADSFQMTDRVTQEWTERHPVWRQYGEHQDRAEIVSWGVSEAVLDREIERLEFCGTQPFFPVLALDSLPASGHLIIAANFVTPSGSEVPGYLLRPHAFGLFVAGNEFTFNLHLTSASAATAERLAAALAESADVFPLRYATGLRDHEGKALDGSIERYW
jgi:hypothetical protein